MYYTTILVFVYIGYIYIYIYYFCFLIQYSVWQITSSVYLRHSYKLKFQRSMYYIQIQSVCLCLSQNLTHCECDSYLCRLLGTTTFTYSYYILLWSTNMYYHNILLQCPLTTYYTNNTITTTTTKLLLLTICSQRILPGV